jgi:hypothetical protein
MKKLLALALALCLLTGCAPLLERSYSTVEPHSSKFWESEAAGTLRAENYQDVVNDLLLLIGQHTESATLRLYGQEDDLSVSDILERAAAEIQQETPMGAYAVEYITSAVQPQRSYYEVTLSIGYRRSAEQIQAVVNATSTEAVYSLLESALDAEKTELAIRIAYWSDEDRGDVEAAVAQLREERQLTETPDWLVNYYPSEDAVGLIEFLLDPPATLEPEEPEEGTGETLGVSEESEKNPEKGIDNG